MPFSSNRLSLLSSVSLAGIGAGLAAGGAGWLGATVAGAGGVVLGLLAVVLGAMGVHWGTQQTTDTAQPRSLDWLDAPACLTDTGGRVLARNAVWGHADLAAVLGDGFYAALRAARAGGHAENTVSLNGHSGTLRAHRDGAHLIWVWRSTDPAVHAQAAPQAAAPVVPQGFGSALEAAPFGVARLDGADPLNSAIVEVNPALAQMTNGAARLGVRFADLIDPTQGEDTRQSFARAHGKPVEARLGDPAHDVHMYAAQTGGQCVLYVVDTSAHKQLEAQLAQGQKMQAIGQLAGGVAHDFNNLLTAIHLRLDELLSRHPVGDPSYGDLREISQTASRAGSLVKKLLAFSRKQTFKRDVLEVGDLISDLAVLLSRLLTEDVKLEIVHGRDISPIKADRSQIETAIMNLATNARDAMRGRPAAKLTIRTRMADAAEVRERGGDAADGAYAVIEVADNGAGIPPEIQQKIFEPFFTTKAVGEGTGLGLATVYGIVKQSDGFLTLDSTVGQGTTFTIYLPAHIAVAGGEPVTVASSAPKAPPPPADMAGRGRILLVEDEDSVRVMAAKLLRARGYEVFEAEDGEIALEFLSGPDNPGIDLMISDVVMPSMDGPTLLKNAKPYLENTRVIFISGYAEEEFSSVLDTENVSFLPKPFAVKDLAERVKAELGTPQPA
jgi:two-component system cell cycle sensor histidine kinase/response regulator CckA